METLLKWLLLARKKPFFAFVVLLLLVLMVGGVAYLTGMLSELGRQQATLHAPETILVTDGTHHVGDEIRDEYPTEKEGRILEKTFGFQLKAKPITAVLLIEAFDVDLYGVRAFVNGKSIGKLRIGDPWQETQLTLPSSILSPGPNRITIRSETPAEGKVEDCLFRNVRVAVQY